MKTLRVNLWPQYVIAQDTNKMPDKDLHLDIPEIDLTMDDKERALSSVVEKMRDKKHKKNVLLLVAGMFSIARIDAHTAIKPEVIFPPEQPDQNAKLLEQLGSNHQEINISQHIEKPMSNYRNPFVSKLDEKNLKTRYANQQFNLLKKKFCIIKTKHK